VLDAQNFGVAQRRKRVFVVGHFGDWKPAAEVLFESESLSGDIKPSRKTREEITRGFVPGVANCLQTTCNDYSRADGFKMIAEPTISFDERNIQFFSNQNYQTCPTLTATDNKGAKGVLTPMSTAVAEHQTYIAYNIRECASNNTFNATKTNTATTLQKTQPSVQSHHTQTFIAQSFGWQNSSHQGMSVDTISPTLDKSKTPAVFNNMAVRRLTPVECERLQGFPDNYTNIPKALDGNRYRALGNSMAVPVMRWIGERINEYERTHGRN
jgi:DNA (cytosine-5)-methyltransferase 1